MSMEGQGDDNEETFTPDVVLNFQAPTKGFLCPLSANTYGIEFRRFEIQDYDSGERLFLVEAPPSSMQAVPPELSPEAITALRTIRYPFPKSFLSLRTIRTSLVFSVGPKEAPNFRMVERHYFRNQLLRSYDFTFGFCIPNSTNTWEAVYDMPSLTPEQVEEISSSPWESSSDSFYFVDNRLVMHNKAQYSYT